jgi:uncharacterized protein
MTMDKRFLSPACTGIELRFAKTGEDDDDVKVDISAADAVVGYAAKFNVRSEPLGDFIEIIEPGAFDDVLGDDVVALFNHDPSQVLARTSAGSLRLSVDEVGLRYEFDLADDDCSEQVAKYINDGRVKQSSFAFDVASGGDRWERQDDGSVLRTITKFKRLYDVSPVTYPAYPDATVKLRSLAFEEASKAEADAAAAERLARANRRARELELIKPR